MNMTTVALTTTLLAVVLPAMAATETVTYQYDDAGRLIIAAYESDGTNAVISYAYDPNGNRTNLVMIGANDTSVDTDGDNFADLHELIYFGDLDETPDGDPDDDGLNNTNDIAQGGNPALADTDADGMDDGDEAVAGTALNDGDDVFEVANVESVPAGSARIWWNVVNGRSYQLQTRSSLMDGLWGDAGAQHDATSNGTHHADHTYDTNAFFRVKVWMTL